MLRLPAWVRPLAAAVVQGGLARETVRVARTLREVERARWREGPGTLLPRLRARGTREKDRSPEARTRLFRVIHHLDRLFPGGTNCYRQALTRVALDAASAREPFVLGLDLSGGPIPGHAWIEGTEAARFDVEFRI